MRLNFDPTIKAGDVLTSITVAATLTTLAYTIDKDRLNRELEQANKVRVTAAAALGRLDRWQAVQLARFTEMHGAAVEISEHFAGTREAASTRDALWKRFTQTRAQVARQIVDEQLGTGYADLLAYFPSARTRYAAAYASLSKVEEDVSAGFLAVAENAIRAQSKAPGPHDTSVLGNTLRGLALQYEDQLRQQSDKVLAPTRDYLLGVVTSSNADLLKAASPQR